MTAVVPLQFQGQIEPITSNTERFPWLIGKSSSFTQVVQQAKRAAESDCHVLITGETGTGKELIARAIHETSQRSGELVAVNVAAVPEGLVESELFGHARGAFTGASTARDGCFISAEAGTLLLDEVGDLDLPSQTKLLRVLEEQRVRPVGKDELTRTNARVLAATSRNLEKLVQEGKFRQDLFYRLNVLRIHVPALRERPDDIPLLVDFFVKDAANRHCKGKLRVEASLMEWLKVHQWPGNVRQLRNIVESLVVLCDSDLLKIQDLPEVPEQDQSADEVAWEEGTLREIENRLIRQRLKRFDGNKRLAAQSLDISVRTIQRRIADVNLIG